MRKYLLLLFLVASLIGCDQSIPTNISSGEIEGISVRVLSLDQYMVEPYSTSYETELSALRTQYLDDIDEITDLYTRGLITLTELSTRNESRAAQYRSDVSDLSSRYLTTEEAWGQIQASIQIVSNTQTQYRVEATIEYWNGETIKSYSPYKTASIGTYNTLVSFDAVGGARGDRGIVSIKAVR